MNRIWILDWDDRFIVKGAALAAGMAVDFLRDQLNPGQTAYIEDDAGCWWRLWKQPKRRADRRGRTVELIAQGSAGPCNDGRTISLRHLQAVMGCWSW